MKKTAYFGAGCFWHAENEYAKLSGVIETEVGYCDIVNKSKLSSLLKKTIPIEVVKVGYEKDIISYKELIDTFWTIHDATHPKNAELTYSEKSVLFCLDKDQEKIANQELNSKRSGDNEKPILTEIHPFISYKKASQNHQKYFQRQG